MRWNASVTAVSVSAAAAVLVAVLAARLPADAFFSGDPGLKLIAAYNAIDHPGRALQIDYPRIGTRVAPYVEKFFWPHGDHAHVLQSPFFPVLCAPFIALFGLRGAYVVPALSWLALVPLLELVRRRATPWVSPLLLGAIVVLANPLFFYALEFWEHTSAAMLLAASTALLWSTVGRRRTRAIVAGVLAACAMLLRPESLWYAAGLAIVCGSVSRMTWFAAGMATVLLPFAVLNTLYIGAPAGPHATWNLALLRDAWLPARAHRADLWLVPHDRYALLGMCLIVAAWLVPGRGAAPRGAQALGLFGAAVIGARAAGHAFTRDLLWQAWPLGLVLLIPRRFTREERRLGVVAGVTIAGVVLSATHDGGAQWGPRFLFIASPAMLVLAAAAAHDLARGDGVFPRLRPALVAVLLAVSVVVTRLAYHELLGTKRGYAVIVQATRANVPPQAYVVTNIWWFEQVTAALYRRNTVLFAENARTAARLARALQGAGAPAVAFVESTEETPWLTLTTRLGRTCYSAAPSCAIAQRGVVFTLASCNPALTPPATTPRAHP